tara:strand:+ start:1315 stop:1590 length:276 start_codon:yes stop_codon:yes gene_type:complete
LIHLYSNRLKFDLQFKRITLQELIMKVVYHEGQDWSEKYLKYGGNDTQNYYIWIGSGTFGVWRFIKLNKNIKRSIHVTDIPSEDVSNDIFE